MLKPSSPPQADEAGDKESQSMDELLRQAELLANQMQGLGLGWTSANGAKKVVSSSNTSREDQRMTDDSATSAESTIEDMLSETKALMDNLDHSTLTKLEKSLNEREDNMNAEEVIRQAEILAAQFQSSVATADSSSDVNSTAAQSSHMDEEAEQNLDALLEQAELLAAQMKSSARSVDSKSTADACNPIKSSSDEEEHAENDLDAMLGQAEILAAQMQSSSRSVGSKSSADGSPQMKSSSRSVSSKSSADGSHPLSASSAGVSYNDEEGEQDLDVMLGHAQALAVQMGSASRSVNSKSSADVDTSGSANSNGKDDNVSIDDMLRRAEVLAAEMQSESLIVGSKSKEDTKQTPNMPQNSTPRDASGIPASAIRRALASEAQPDSPTFDTPKLIRESETMLGTNPSNYQAMDTPALVRQANELLAKSDESFPTTPVTTPVTPKQTISTEDDILKQTEDLLAMMQSTEPEPKNETEVGDASNDSLGVAPSTPNQPLNESTDLMERALLALKEASAQCSTPTPPELQTPTSVSIAPVMDEVSSVGSESVRSFPSFRGDSPRDFSNRKMAPMPARRFNKAPNQGNADRPPVAPRVTPIAEQNAVDAVLEETRMMALTLQQMSGATKLQQKTVDERDEKDVIAGVPAPSIPLEHDTIDDDEQSKSPELTLEKLASLDKDEDKVTMSDFTSTRRPSTPKQAIDPCLRFEKAARKADPSAKYVKVTTASVGDDDYAPMVDYTPKKSRGAAVKSISPSGRHSSCEGKKLRKVLFRIAAVSLAVLFVIYCRTLGAKENEIPVSGNEIDTVVEEGIAHVGEMEGVHAEGDSVNENGKKESDLSGSHVEDEAKTKKTEVRGASDLLLEQKAAALDSLSKLGTKGATTQYLETTSEVKAIRSPVLRKLKRVLTRSIKLFALLGFFALPLRFFLLS